MVMPPRWKWTFVAMCAAGCGPQVSVDDAGSDSDMETSGPGGPTTGNDTATTGMTGMTSATDPSGPDPTGPAPVPTSNAVDILLVVDNSGTMGPAQARVAAAIGTLVEVLDAAGADWRIGVTTTDNGNPWCEGTTPEGGKLVASSCRARTQDFLFMGAAQADATQEACLDVCPEEWTEIAIAEPWIAKSGDVTNLPAGLDPVQALRCILPQGINGCGFEEQLESLYKALLRSTTAGEESFGFLRPDAVLGVLVITDEVDCSFNKNFETIFLPDGNRVFWSDPESSAPSSAVCWNAGVACSGGPGTYDECHAVDLDVDGVELPAGEAEQDAALLPVSRYTSYLQAIEDGKKAVNPGAEVVLAVLGGFTSSGAVVYEDGIDAQHLLDFGIAPGCDDGTIRGLPPVRMRDIADVVSAGAYPSKFSICDSDYTAAFEGFGKAIAGYLP
jgi:hypothetical protein